jgi:predicted O-linked N-acetylglucosamine transferase (SPINDLY family)
MLSQRQQFANHVFHFCQTADKNLFKFDDRDSIFFEVDSSLDRIHFYLAYHGLNDRPLQEAVQRAYCAILSGCSFVAPNLRYDNERESQVELVVKRQVIELAKETPNPSPVNFSKNSVRRIRIGFLSKFFGLFEPHGLLLDGVMNLLPRSHFHVLVLGVARNDAKPLHHTVSRAAKTTHVDGKSTSNVVEIPLHLNLAARTIIALNLDVLVFAGNISSLCQVFSHLSFSPQTSCLPTVFALLPGIPRYSV